MAIVEDRLEYRTSDPVAKWAFHALEAGLRLGRTVDRAIPAAIDVGSGE